MAIARMQISSGTNWQTATIAAGAGWEQTLHPNDRDRVVTMERMTMENDLRKALENDE